MKEKKEGKGGRMKGEEGSAKVTKEAGVSVGCSHVFTSSPFLCVACTKKKRNGKEERHGAAWRTNFSHSARRWRRGRGNTHMVFGSHVLVYTFLTVSQF